MQVIELSDHPSRMLQETERRRGAAQRQARAQFEAAHAQQLERISRAVAARDQARAQRRWWAWWRAALTLRRERRRVPLAPQETASGDDDRQEILKAGIAGERTVVSGLAQLFGDDWILFRGYRNRGGEIDHLLLGPAGLIAIEGKHRNATVHCDGDNWWLTSTTATAIVWTAAQSVTGAGARQASSSTSRPTSCRNSCGRAGSPSKSSAWFCSPIPGHGSGHAATQQSGSLPRRTKFLVCSARRGRLSTRIGGCA